MEKYRESIELAEQITKYLKGKLSPEEEVELKKRLHAHPEGEQLLARVRDERSIAAKKEMYASFSADKSWERIRKVTGKKSSGMMYRMFWWAAVFALPLAVAASILLVNKSKQEDRPQYIVDAYFESNKTMLELPGGKCIALDTVKNVTKELNDFGVTLAEGQGLDYSGLDSVMDAKVEYHKVVVPRGGEYNLKLADGTNVWMFAESEIRFPTRFEGNKREVYLSGEAYFEVHHDPVHPFYVKTKSLDVKVLGTSFNVKAYNNMEVVETSLVEGVVSVKDNVLRPNMQAVFHKNTGDFSYRKINGESYRLRKERVFVFDEERLDDILQEMARWYDFEIFYQNPEMADKRFGFKLEKYEHVDTLLDILELTGEVRFTMKGKTLTVMSGT
ncbi:MULTISPECIES: FecR family protein [Butyricimonas]|uniref:FecR family protein n=1 Tax=Butyricimonas TaxID=574697 RepID=UPI001D098A3F|nr:MULTISPECIES: FecR family protein [Butyricimonas]MCB6972266.1 FecR family protein [Butyricimonas synergistica]MCG4519171.1 FecR family protein [Butyricimonas sp. DFI.6.44]